MNKKDLQPEDILGELSMRVHLRKEEKEKARTQIMEYAAMRPVRTKNLQTGTWFRLQTLEIFSYRIPVAPAFMAILLVIIGLGSGVSYAAEGSLPGEFLYPIKLVVNEQVRSFLAMSNEAQALWDAQIMERRLHEAEELTLNRQLSEDIFDQITINLEEQQEKLRTILSKLENDSNDDSAFEVTAKVGAVLDAHEEILSRLHDDAEVDADSRERLGSIIQKVAHTGTEVKSLRANTENRIKTNKSAPVASEGKFNDAETSLRSAKKLFEKAEGEISPAALSEIEIKLRAASDSIHDAKADLTAGKYDEAFSELQHSLRLSHEARVLTVIALSEGVEEANNDRGANQSATAELKMESFSDYQGTDREEDGEDAASDTFQMTAPAQEDESANKVEVEIKNGRIRFDFGM